MTQRRPVLRTPILPEPECQLVARSSAPPPPRSRQPPRALPLADARAHRYEPNPQQGGTLPPAIAALKPMTAGVKPITIDERRARIDKATRLMRENKIDALMLTGGTSLQYFTNIRWGLSERMLALILPVKGTPFIVCPKFEEGRAMEQVRTGPLDKGTEVHTWEEDDSPSALIADGLRSRGLATGTLGIEETVRYVFSDNVSKALPTLRLTSGTPITAGCRGVKSDAELALMRHASAVTLKAYEAAWKSLADGMTQNQFAEPRLHRSPATRLPAAMPACRSASTRRCRTGRSRRRSSGRERSCSSTAAVRSRATTPT